MVNSLDVSCFPVRWFLKKMHSNFKVVKSLLNALYFEYIEIFLISDLILLHVFGIEFPKLINSTKVLLTALVVMGT